MLANRVREFTTTVGTGDITLGGALAGHVGFAEAFTVGDSVIYVIEDGDNYEIGTGTLTDATTLARTSVEETLVDGTLTKTGASAITLSGGARIYCAATAQFLLDPIEAADVITEVTPDAGVTVDGVLLKDGSGVFTGDAHVDVIKQTDDLGDLVLSGGTATNVGANMRLVSSGGTNALDIDCRINGTRVLQWDNSAGHWNFHNNDIAGVGSATFVGDIDMQSGQVFDVTNIYRGTEAGRLVLSGGSSEVLGANITLFAENRAADANDMAFKADGTSWLYWDNSAGIATFTGMIAGNNGALLTGASTANARFTFTQTTAGLSAQIQQGSSGFALAALGAQSLFLQTNGANVLTLDSSQNATFAGDVTLGNLTSIGIDDNSLSTVLTLQSSGRADFAGDVSISNTNSFRVGGATDTFVGELGNDGGVLSLITDTNRDIQFGDTSGNTLKLDTSAKSATFSGDVTAGGFFQSTRSNYAKVALNSTTSGVEWLVENHSGDLALTVSGVQALAIDPATYSATFAGDATISGNVEIGANSTSPHGITFKANRTSDSQQLGRLSGSWNGGVVCQIDLWTGNDTVNKDNGQISFFTQNNSAGGLVQALLLDESQNATFAGDVSVNGGTGSVPLAVKANALDTTAIAVNSSDNVNHIAVVGSSALGGGLVSLRNSSAVQTISLDGATGTVNTTGKLIVDGGAKISVQNSVNGGPDYGLYLFDTNDNNWVQYAANASGTSPNSATPCSSLDNRTGYHIRLRAFNGSTQGFLWENSSEECLMSLTADTGDLYVRGSYYGESGSAAIPVHSFTSDPDTGMYRTGTNGLGFTTGGVQRIGLSATALDVYVPVDFQGNTVVLGSGLELNSSGLYMESETQVLTIAGGSDFGSGGNVLLYGDSHAMNANDIVFRSNTTNRLRWDNDASAWDFNTNVIKGVSDIGRGTTTGQMHMSGGSTFNKGGNVLLYGESHSTSAGDIRLRTDTTSRLHWDDSAGYWDFYGNDVIGVGDITLQGSYISRDVDNSSVSIAGGTTNSGAVLSLTGGVHATQPSEFIFKDATTRVLAYATNTWNFQDNNIITTGKLIVDGGAKISVQNKVDGGSGQGIFLYDTDSTDWGIYMAQDGSGRSLADGTACDSLDTRGSQHIRFRVYNSAVNGFLWENNSEQCLMSLGANNGNLYTLGRQYSALGTAASPSHSFTSDIDTGMYHRASGEIGFSSNGVEAVWLSSNGIRVPDGNVAGPGFRFKDDLDTGFYRISADTIGISLAGVERARFTTGAGIPGNSGLWVGSGSSISLVVGGDSTGPTLTDTTLKAGRIAIPHYTNSEEPLGVVYAYSDTTENRVNIGGGSSSTNAANTLYFWTAANTITPTGTLRLSIGSDGTANFQNNTVTNTGDIQLGTNNAIYGTANNNTVSIAGGNASNAGANIQLRGGSHPDAGDIVLRTGTNTRLQWDDSAAAWNFQGNNVAGVGDLSINSDEGIHRSNETGELRLSGGSSDTSGMVLKLYGKSHATNAYDFGFRKDAGDFALFYNDSDSTFDFQGNDITTTGKVGIGGSVDAGTAKLNVTSSSATMLRFDRTIDANVDTAFSIFVSNDGSTATDFVALGATSDALRVYGNHTVKAMNDLEVGGIFSLGTPTELTISSGAITITKSFHTVDTEADAATDDLATINGGAVGDILVLQTVTASRVITLKDDGGGGGVGNLLLAGDCTLNDSHSSIMLVYRDGFWREISRSNNA